VAVSQGNLSMERMKRLSNEFETQPESLLKYWWMVAVLVLGFVGYALYWSFGTSSYQVDPLDSFSTDINP
jgi:hypothetical protein